MRNHCVTIVDLPAAWNVRERQGTLASHDSERSDQLELNCPWGKVASRLGKQSSSVASLCDDSVAPAHVVTLLHSYTAILWQRRVSRKTNVGVVLFKRLAALQTAA
jgi:hypothetical protein